MAEQVLTCRLVDGIPVFLFPAYFQEETGKALHQMANELFKQKHLRFVLDFQTCKVLNSRGIASLMNFAMKCLDDYRGKLVMVHLDPPTIQVLGLVGAIPLVPVADSLEAGLEMIKDE